VHEERLGIGTTTDSHVPWGLDAWSPVVIISAGGRHTCAVVNEGTPTSPYCWGSNSQRQVGIDGEPYYTVPEPVTGTSVWNMRFMEIGDTHSCGISLSSDVLCWGGNASGQLGIGTTEDTEVPTVVDMGGVAAATVTAGDSHTCAHRQDGIVMCWGRNDKGQLGNGTTEWSSTPVAVTGLSGEVAQLSAGGEHTCALMQSGIIYCWGGNADGQLGNAGWVDSPSAVIVTGLEGSVVRVSAGGAHTCALLDGGEIKCWGKNDHGQLGDGSNTSSPTPVSVLVE
jgi:alpha-tubulin suppressor-like RCC1 family protein